MNHPIFTISLDFELLWGVFDKVNEKIDKQYFLKTRQLIPDILRLFEKYNIEATWATVGMLFAENEEEWNSYQPSLLPSYKDQNLSAYQWVRSKKLDSTCHFAPEIIKEIMTFPGQEIGSHTFSHYFTLSKGQTPSQFRADLQAAQKIAKDKFDLSLKSLVFPRNHINPFYMDICWEEGFEQVRVNPPKWYWQETQHEGLLKKAVRSLDCYFGFGERSSYDVEKVIVWQEKLKLMPASRILKPINQKFPLTNARRIQRIKEEMSSAAKNQEVYHLWWHPHNFAVDPQRALGELESILAHYLFLKNKYGMKSMSMQRFGDFLNK
ncbi:polysaccharide deacetylase family protein [Belliella sp. DSM 107340]|uniref:Polysaccharide deacetylase family protein n=1 Tax=Belliella calami TaxID=2923436 RepID=A0ABS9UIQ1_9BACT|nr:polysaccharide deacetylase family protein [Belliella calami]MCH7396498.1 polysaccharide deacetylase family protein [Belliella calami]